MNQQLDTDGGLHDISPRHEQPRLFTADPQIRGQLGMVLDDMNRRDLDAWVRNRAQALGHVASGRLSASAYRARVQEFKQRHGEDFNQLVNNLAVAMFSRQQEEES